MPHITEHELTKEVFVAVRQLTPSVPSRAQGDQGIALPLPSADDYLQHTLGPFEFSWTRQHKDLVRIRDTSAFGIDAWVRRADLEALLRLYCAHAEAGAKDTAKSKNISAAYAELYNVLRSRGFWVPKNTDDKGIIEAVGRALDSMRKPLQDFVGSHGSSDQKTNVFTSALGKIDATIKMGRWVGDVEPSAAKAIVELTDALQQLREITAKLLEAGHITEQSK